MDRSLKGCLITKARVPGGFSIQKEKIKKRKKGSLRGLNSTGILSPSFRRKTKKRKIGSIRGLNSTGMER